MSSRFASMNGTTKVQRSCDLNCGLATFYDSSSPADPPRPKDQQTGSRDYCFSPPFGEWREPSGGVGREDRQTRAAFQYSLATEQLKARSRPFRFFASPTEALRALYRHYSI